MHRLLGLTLLALLAACHEDGAVDTTGADTDTTGADTDLRRSPDAGARQLLRLRTDVLPPERPPSVADSTRNRVVVDRTSPRERGVPRPARSCIMSTAVSAGSAQ